MRELKQILDFWQKISAAGQPAVLATVVRTQGSSYRLPGARMLLAEDGRHVGGISGGCLEDDIVKKAWWRTSNGPVVCRYDTNAEGEISGGGYGMGCNGIIHVLLERLAPRDCPVLEALSEVVRSRRTAAIAHVVGPDSQFGGRLLLNCDGSITNRLSSNASVPEIQAELNVLKASVFTQVGPDTGVFFEKLAPPVRLMIFGAGDDAIALTELAHFLGWQTCVFDGRAHYAKPAKFPLADLVAVRPLGGPIPEPDPWSAAVVMTHSYSQDLDILKTLMGLKLRYLGVLGPRKRTMQLAADASAEAQNSFSDVYTPMGLDLGGDGPQQVALAVVAEVQSVFQGRPGGALRNRLGPIHDSESSAREGSGQRPVACV
jgi:xanthine dehydrogenase accessory factor